MSLWFRPSSKMKVSLRKPRRKGNRVLFLYPVWESVTVGVQKLER